jgi:hypothetical protein
MCARIFSSVLVVTTLGGCVAGPSEPTGAPTDMRFDLPEAPAADEGFQVVSPDIVVPRGADMMWCWVPDVLLTEDKLVDSFTQYQAQYGHHMVALKSIVPRKPGEQFDCTDIDDMATLQPLLTPTAGNSQEGANALLPPEFAVRLPADSVVVIQSHHVNISDNDILVRDVANIRYLAEGVEKIEANYFVINDNVVNIPPTGVPHSQTTNCTVQQRFQFAAMNGHMHEWGKHITIEHVDGAGVATLYEVPAWHAGLRDSPPIERYPLDAPLVVEAGDTLRVTCEWLNNTDEPLTFPEEMCVALWVYYPALPEGFVVCN